MNNKGRSMSKHKWSEIVDSIERKAFSHAVDRDCSHVELKPLNESHKAKKRIDRLNNKSGSDRLNAWVHWKLLEKDLDEDDKQFALEIQDLLRLCEDQRVEIERLKAFGLGGSMADVFNKNEQLLSHLATQTERVRAMREALKKIKSIIEKSSDGEHEIRVDWHIAWQALNQDSLVDGGKGE